MSDKHSCTLHASDFVSASHGMPVPTCASRAPSKNTQSTRNKPTDCVSMVRAAVRWPPPHSSEHSDHSAQDVRKATVDQRATCLPIRSAHNRLDTLACCTRDLDWWDHTTHRQQSSYECASTRALRTKPMERRNSVPVCRCRRACRTRRTRSTASACTCTAFWCTRGPR